MNFLDIFINYMTKVNEKKKNKGSTENVGQVYFNKDFFVDLLAFFPFDYCFIALISDPFIPAFLRITYIDEEKFHFQLHFMERSLFEKYIIFLYWANETQGAPFEDVIARSSLEKSFQIFCIFTLKIYISFLTAEFTSLLSSKKTYYQNHTTQVNLITEWMNHKQIPLKIRKRILKYYKCLWKKFKGMKDYEILKFLPETISDEILNYILHESLSKIQFFPKKNPEVILSIAKKLKIFALPKGEFLCKQGEINVELYFIIEGYAAIIARPDTQICSILRPGDYYGEEDALSGEKPIIHKDSVKAITDITVGLLSLKDFIALSKDHSILAKTLEKHRNNDVDGSLVAPEEHILNSSIFSSGISNLSQIEEEKDSEIERSKRNNVSHLMMGKKSIQYSHFFMATSEKNTNLSGNIHNSKADEFHQTKEFLNKPFNEEILPGINLQQSQSLNEDTLILDYENVYPVKSELPPLISSKTQIFAVQELSEIDGINNSFSFEEEISYNFIIDQMEKPQPLQSNTDHLSFNLNEFAEEENDINEHKEANDDNAILEISSISVVSDQSSFEYFVEEKISLKRKIAHIMKSIFSKRFLRSKEVKTFILFYISLFNAIYVPLSLIFNQFDYPPTIIALEIVNFLYLIYIFVKKVVKYLRGIKRANELKEAESHKLTRNDENAIIIQLKTRSEIYLALFIDFLYIIPFPFIIRKSEVSHSFVQLLCIFRLIHVKYIIRGIHYLKEKLGILGSILQIVILSAIFIHLFACILLNIALSEEDFNHSLLRRFPAPELSFVKTDRERLDISDSSIYIHTLYWVYATISKSGVMEMQVVSLPERVFGIFVMTVGGLFYIFVFSNMVSLVEDLTPKMRSILEKQEKKVLKYIRQMNMKGLEKKIEGYFTQIWKSDKGFNENDFLKSLPLTIKVDLQKCQYLQIFRKSPFFGHGKLNPRPDSSLIYSLFKFLQTELFNPKDLIIFAGEYCNKVYFILEGRVELISFNLKTKIVLQSGDFFGGINKTERQPGYIKALTFCKIGFLEADTFEILKERFPIWYQKMIVQMKKHKTTLLRDLSFYKSDYNSGILETSTMDFRIIDEKIIEHYYPIYLEIEKDIYGEVKNEKILKKELERMMHTSVGNNRLESNDPFISPPSKRPNIVELMNQKTVEVPTLFNKIKRLSSRVHPFQHTNTLTKIINIKTMFDLKKSYCILPNSKIRILFDIIHIIFIIYNSFALPFYIGFEIDNNFVMIILEISYISANLLHIIVEMKTSIYIDGILTTDCLVLLKNYYKTGPIFLDIFCILPINLALASFHSVYTSLFRITRIIQTFYINYFLKNLQSKNRNFSSIIAIFKSFFILACIWHWSSCYWFWVNVCVEDGTDELTWLHTNHLDHESLIYKYALALYFSINIASTAAFPEQFPSNNTERMFFIVLIYVGDACFATAFALISDNTAVFPLKFNEIFKSINRVKLMLQDSKISSHVSKRMEEYYTHLIKLRQENQASISSIQHYLTENMYNELRYLKAKPFLCGFPIFSEVKSPMALREIAEKLQYAMFLPRDYIIFRNDIGEEMYFIIEGNVLVLTPREDAVIAVLKKGNYFGEIALFTQSSKRICSVISGSFCELYVLNKQFLNRILEGYPRIKEIFKKESERRFNEYRRQSLANKAFNLKDGKSQNQNLPKSKLSNLGRSKSFKGVFKKVEKEEKTPILPLNSQENMELPEIQKMISHASSREENSFEKSSPTSPLKKSNLKTKPPSMFKNTKLTIQVKKVETAEEREEKKQVTIKTHEDSVLKSPPNLRKNTSQSKEFLSPQVIGSPKSPLSIGKLSPSQISDNMSNDEQSPFKKHTKNFLFKSKLQFMDVNDSSDDDSQRNGRNGDLDGSLCEYVEENELDEGNMNKKRQSRRRRRRSKERRHSRISLRKEVNFSKNLGIELEWGININED